jgi:hypothetical protein
MSLPRVGPTFDWRGLITCVVGESIECLYVSSVSGLSQLRLSSQIVICRIQSFSLLNRTDQFISPSLRNRMSCPSGISPSLSLITLTRLCPPLPHLPHNPPSPIMCYVYGSVQVTTSVCPMCKYFKSNSARYPPIAFSSPLPPPSHFPFLQVQS